MRKAAYGALAACLSGWAFAAHASEGGGGGMPQLNFHDFAPQVVWLAITFVVLYFVMSKLAIPAIGDTLEKRQAKIQGDLDAAEKASEDTRALVAAYEKRLADAREEARRLGGRHGRIGQHRRGRRRRKFQRPARLDEGAHQFAPGKSRCLQAHKNTPILEGRHEVRRLEGAAIREDPGRTAHLPSRQA